VEFVMNYQSYVYPKLEYNKPLDEIYPSLDDKEKNFLKSMNLENPENKEETLNSSKLNSQEV